MDGTSPKSHIAMISTACAGLQLSKLLSSRWGLLYQAQILRHKVAQPSFLETTVHCRLDEACQPSAGLLRAGLARWGTITSHHSPASDLTRPWGLLYQLYAA